MEGKGKGRGKGKGHSIFGRGFGGPKGPGLFWPPSTSPSNAKDQESITPQGNAPIAKPLTGTPEEDPLGINDRKRRLERIARIAQAEEERARLAREQAQTDPNQADPSQEDPNQEDPNQEDPNQEDPNQEDPNQEDPNQEDPNQEDPNQEDPNQADPSQADPNQASPNLIRARRRWLEWVAWQTRADENEDRLARERMKANIWANQPDPNQADPDRPDPNRPVPNQPDPDRLDPNRPDPNRPDPNQPVLNQPDPDRPDPNRPDPNQPVPNQPDPDQPDPNQPVPNQPKRQDDNGFGSGWGSGSASGPRTGENPFPNFLASFPDPQPATGELKISDIFGNPNAFWSDPRRTPQRPDPARNSMFMDLDSPARHWRHDRYAFGGSPGSDVVMGGTTPTPQPLVVRTNSVVEPPPPPPLLTPSRMRPQDVHIDYRLVDCRPSRFSDGLRQRARQIQRFVRDHGLNARFTNVVLAQAQALQKPIADGPVFAETDDEDYPAWFHITFRVHSFLNLQWNSEGKWKEWDRKLKMQASPKKSPKKT